jgi:hypothetical protein
MHPCQLFLLALHSDSTRIIMVLLAHEIPALSDLLMGTAQCLLRVDSSQRPIHGCRFRSWSQSSYSSCLINDALNGRERPILLKNSVSRTMKIEIASRQFIIFRHEGVLKIVDNSLQSPWCSHRHEWHWIFQVVDIQRKIDITHIRSFSTE